LPIADAPAVCYLVAPTLAFHREFDLLAATLAPEIEIHRFNLAENWRARPKVLDRCLVSSLKSQVPGPRSQVSSLKS
jgi:hypothetical protein